MADRPNHLERYAVGPADYDPRVMDPMVEEQWWRERAERENRRAWQNMAMGATNAVTGMGTFAASRFPGMPTALRRGMGALGWGQMGIGSLNAGLGALDSIRYRDAADMADRWSQGLPPDYQGMLEGAFRPYPPISR